MTEFNIRKARRGFSLSQGNETLVSEARLIILDKIEESYQNQAPYFKDSTNVTFLLPNLAKYHCKFRAYLEKDLIEQSALLHLEQLDRLNWWCDNECMQRLWPLATTGDGNCLLHAASLAMWGFHDRHLTLRHAVHHRLIHDNFAFHRRWLYQSLADHKSQGFTLSEDEFNEEWSEICNLSFPSPKGSHKPIDISLNNEENENYLECCRKGNLISRYTSEQNNNYYSLINSSQCSKSTLSHVSITPKESFYDFLEQIHIFVLAQVIRRPIIIISDTYVRDADGKPIQPLSFGGLYLPLLEKPELCEKTPILLTYSNSHFSALVPMDLNDNSDACTSHKLPLAVPLIDPVNFELLPIHFSTDPGVDWKTIKLDESNKLKHAQIKNIIQIYLNCEEFKFCPDHKRTKRKSEAVNIEANFDSNKHSLSRCIGKQIKEKFAYKSKSKSNPSYTSHNDSQTINWNKFNGSNSVFGAKLKVHLPLNYNEMIENYLKDAKLNFEKLEDESRQATIEFMSKINIVLDNSDDSHFNSKFQNSQSTSPIDLSNL